MGAKLDIALLALAAWAPTLAARRGDGAIEAGASRIGLRLSLPADRVAFDEKLGQPGQRAIV
jgi:hypothetical protein